LIDKTYQQIVAPILRFKDDPDASSQFTFLDNDVLIDGRSIRETAKTKVMTQIRITEFIKLLVPENPEMSMDDITFEDVEAEFPTSIQLMLIEKIAETVSPNYKESRGN